MPFGRTLARGRTVNGEQAVALNARIETDRLVLEPLVAAHAEALWGPMQDPAVYRWISNEPPESVEALRERWRTQEARLSPTGADAWLGWAARRRADGSWVGKLDAVVDDRNVATNVGYLFFPAFWGQGLATEAVRALVLHLDAMDVREQRATVTDGNRGSARVLEKAGFVHTRILPGNDRIRGVWVDDLEYVRDGTLLGG